LRIFLSSGETDYSGISVSRGFSSGHSKKARPNFKNQCSFFRKASIHKAFGRGKKKESPSKILRILA
jgi:hypothetical protein